MSDLYHAGTRSALELASLGPATVLCESLIYCSTFLAIATTNLQATALADGKTAEAQKVLDISIYTEVVRILLEVYDMRMSGRADTKQTLTIIVIMVLSNIS